MILDNKLMKYVIFTRRTTAEVKEKCKALGFSEDYIEEIIEYLIENGYLNDELYVSKYISNVKKLKKKSIQEIRFELMRKGIQEQYIEQNIDDDLRVFEFQCAFELAKKKYKECADILKTKKYLAGKGYPMAVINKVTERLRDIENGEIERY